MQINKTIRTILQVISLGLLVYILIGSLSRVDIAVTKNNNLISQKKADIDKIQDIQSVKLKAKEYLDTIRQNFISDSDKSFVDIRLLILLIIIQTILLLSKESLRQK
jgi:hypothetical protein